MFSARRASTPAFYGDKDSGSAALRQANPLDIDGRLIIKDGEMTEERSEKREVRSEKTESAESENRRAVTSDRLSSS